MRAIEVIGSISCVLLGAYPMVLLLTRWFEKPLMRVGNLLKINNMAAGGMVATLANNIPMFGMMKQMDTRGKVINCAFSVSAAFAPRRPSRFCGGQYERHDLSDDCRQAGRRRYPRLAWRCCWCQKMKTYRRLPTTKRRRTREHAPAVERRY
ncbi:ethanolamine utilization protein EutH [Klebsiella pneumoniae]|nr:ethanolamine utilization protein EutH [Klebsiella pneumoniae]MCQ9260486.1 ethanolamine utilization protein EutH [Klebsiella pneumoniae]